MEGDEPNSAVLEDNRRGATLSDDRSYRYRLWRTWETEKPTLAWIMLNPSTADETEDDPTLRRCRGFAEEWGYGKIVLGNLFALRSSDPRKIYQHPSPIGPENDDHLREIAEDADRVMAAWGAHGDLCDRASEVARMLGAHLYALDTTKQGQPAHPLYQPADAEPTRWAVNDDPVEKGERYTKSPLTDRYYRVTEWVDKGDGKLVAKDKEEVDREAVPDDVLRDLGEEP